jgi:DNA helicase IV
VRLPAYQELSVEQDSINNLPLDKSYLITGPPGTGKTVMALYRARMLATSKTPASLLMHSRLLMQYTSGAARELKLNGTVNTFHSWFLNYYKARYRHNPPSHGPYDYDWEAILQEVGRNPPPRDALEHLILDEAQDLHRMFFPLARFIARNVTVFADENQRLTATNSTIKEIEAYGGFEQFHRLMRNYRNSREIALLAARFYTGLSTGIPDLPSRSGDMPVMQAFKSLHETVEYIARFERNNPDLQIGVLVHYTRTRDSLFNRFSKEGRTKNKVQRFVGGKGSQAELVDFTRPGITVLCHSSAKGLEFDTLFLPELQEIAADINDPVFRMRMYVLISRARDALHLSYSGDERPKVVDAFPAELLEWR